MISSIITMQTPTPIALPDGYSTTPPSPPEGGARGGVLGETIPGQALYGGADISRQTDGAGVLYIGCCARGPDGDFRFRVFRRIGVAPLVEVGLQARASGRGEISTDLLTGELTWIAWEGSSFYTDVIPGAVPIAIGQPGAPGPAGPPGPAGDYTPCVPSRYYPGLDGQVATGGQSLDIPFLFSLPIGCRAYVVRFVIDADAADVRGRLGPETDPSQCTINTQSVYQEHGSGKIVNAGPGGRVWLSIVDGQGRAASARVWLTVSGYFI